GIRDYKVTGVQTCALPISQRELPLHLICHDDLPRTVLIPERFRPWLERAFGRVYRQAVSRLCVSPFMCEAYRERYGAEGTLLYRSEERRVGKGGKSREREE